MRRWPARLPFVIVVGAGKRIKVGKTACQVVCGRPGLHDRHDPTCGRPDAGALTPGRARRVFGHDFLD